MSMSLTDFRALKKTEIAIGNVKKTKTVIDGIAYGPEDLESYLFHSWLVAKGIFAIHVPNQRVCSVQEMVMLKSMGLYPGASDHHIMDSPPIAPHFKGVLVEMKHGKGKATAAQLDYLAEMRRRGWLGAVCRGSAEAVRYMEELGY